MSHAVAKLSGFEPVPPSAIANIAHKDEYNSCLFYTIRPVGEGLDEWFAAFQAEQRKDGRESPHRFYEVLPKDAITKLAFRIPSDGTQDENIVRAACGYVAQKLLSPPSYEASDVSFWYRLDGHLYGVWPMIAMNAFDRQAAADLLATGPHEQWHPFQRSWLDHYYCDGGKRIEFPLPAAGAQFVGVYNHEALPKTYNASLHGRRMGHLVHNGGFLFNADPAINALQIETVSNTLRIGLLTNLLVTRDRRQAAKDPGYNARFVSHRMSLRESARLRQQAPAPGSAPVRQLDRLNWIHALDVFGPDAVVVLQQCLARDGDEVGDDAAGIPEYYHTFNQMNRWFMFETKKNVLYVKSHDEKRYMDDYERPERYLQIEPIPPQVVRQTLDAIKVMRANPGKPPKYVNIYDAWISHPQCNRVTSVVTCPLPSEDPLINPYKIPGMFNKWRGWDFYAHGHYDRLHMQLHDKSLEQLLMVDDIRTIVAFIYGMLCDQDVECFRMINLILANVLQRPDSRPEKAVFLKGPEGVGKSLFSKGLVLRVFGFTHAAEFDKTDYLIGHFNDGGSGKGFVVLEEALITDKQSISRFQQLVTGEHQSVNGKFLNVRTEKNFATFWGNTNVDFPFQVNQNGRRYVLVEVSPLVEFLNAKQKVGLFDRIASILDSDRIFAYAYFLSRIPLDEWFKVRKGTVLENVELGKMKLMSMQNSKPVPSWLMGCAQARTFGQTDAEVEVVWGQPAPITDLYNLFLKTRKYPMPLSNFVHEFCRTLGRVEGFNSKYAATEEEKIARGSKAAWVKLPIADKALAAIQARIGGSAEVGSMAVIDKQLEHEDKLIKLSEVPKVTVEQLMPENTYTTDDNGNTIWDTKAIMLTLFGAVDKILVPCQQE